MSKRRLPKAPQGLNHPRIEFDCSPSALARWKPGICASRPASNSIEIFDEIGADPWTGAGVTTERISAELRRIGAGQEVTLNLNSPGGDLFEGLAIYNLLREHDGRVTVKVLGLAASAASLVAMAGDRIEIARSGFLMIHNAWIFAIGNRHDLREFAEQLEPFDRSMADIYGAHTGMDRPAMQKLMDAETWIGGSDAVDQGFADALLPSDQIGEQQDTQAMAVREIEAALRNAGMSRSRAKDLIRRYKVELAEDVEPVVADPQAAAAHETLELLKSFTFDTKEH